MSDIQELIEENENKADSVNFLLNALVDGGNTQILETEVIISTPVQNVELYNELLENSPYLSDTVMVEAINKEDVLNSAMITDVLVANPQSAKSEEVMLEVENRVNSLPDYMIEEIEGGQDSIGDKESLEASKFYFQNERSFYLNELMNIFRYDTSNLIASDSLIGLLNELNTIHAKYLLAFEYLNRQEYTYTSSVLNSIPTLFNLSDEQFDLYQDYLALSDILIDTYQDSTSFDNLDSEQILLLDDIASDAYSYPGMYARNILQYIGHSDYLEPYILPDTSMKTTENWSKSPYKIAVTSILKVYPNPASNYLILEYNMDYTLNNGEVVIRSISGEIVFRRSLLTSRNLITIPVSKFSNGTYVVSLFNGGKSIASEKFIVIH